MFGAIEASEIEFCAYGKYSFAVSNTTTTVPTTTTTPTTPNIEIYRKEGRTKNENSTNGIVLVCANSESFNNDNSNSTLERHTDHVYAHTFKCKLVSDIADSLVCA